MTVIDKIFGLEKEAQKMQEKVRDADNPTRLNAAIKINNISLRILDLGIWSVDKTLSLWFIPLTSKVKLEGLKRTLAELREKSEEIGKDLSSGDTDRALKDTQEMMKQKDKYLAIEAKVVEDVINIRNLAAIERYLDELKKERLEALKLIDMIRVFSENKKTDYIPTNLNIKDERKKMWNRGGNPAQLRNILKGKKLVFEDITVTISDFSQAGDYSGILYLKLEEWGDHLIDLTSNVKLKGVLEAIKRKIRIEKEGYTTDAIRSLIARYGIQTISTYTPHKIHYKNKECSLKRVEGDKLSIEYYSEMLVKPEDLDEAILLLHEFKKLDVINLIASVKPYGAESIQGIEKLSDRDIKGVDAFIEASKVKLEGSVSDALIRYKRLINRGAKFS